MRIHYFQRYHSKENVDTSNVMLMLSRLYHYSSTKFFNFLKEFVLPSEAEPELNFVLQEKSEQSIPDATITQHSFKIAVETKLYNQFTIEQLVNHLSTFGNEEYKVLLTLDPKPMKEELVRKLEKSIREYNAEHGTNIIHCNMTFEMLLDDLKSVIDDRDYEMLDVLDDFETYCFEEKLIPDSYKYMLVFAVGATVSDNLELNLYYDLASRNYRNHAYLGLYTKKAVCAIGMIVKTAISEYVNEEWRIKEETGDSLTENEKNSIRIAIQRSNNYGYNLKVAHRFYFVEKFYETDYRKNTAYAIQKAKFFDLTEVLHCTTLPDVDKIAEKLKHMEW